jgi:hypothetical protein
MSNTHTESKSKTKMSRKKSVAEQLRDNPFANFWLDFMGKMDEFDFPEKQKEHLYALGRLFYRCSSIGYAIECSWQPRKKDLETHRVSELLTALNYVSYFNADREDDEYEMRDEDEAGNLVSRFLDEKIAHITRDTDEIYDLVHNAALVLRKMLSDVKHPDR